MCHLFIWWNGWMKRKSSLHEWKITFIFIYVIDLIINTDQLDDVLKAAMGFSRSWGKRRWCWWLFVLCVNEQLEVTRILRLLCHYFTSQSENYTEIFQTKCLPLKWVSTNFLAIISFWNLFDIWNLEDLILNFFPIPNSILLLFKMRT